MEPALQDLIDVLDLERIEVDIFRGRTVTWHPQVRVFGGQVAAQALVAASRTVPADRPVHSLHAYFLRPGDPSVPIVYQVDRIRDGRSFATRRVVAVQHGKAIFNLSASFHVTETGLDHQRPLPDGIPTPDELADRVTLGGDVVAPNIYDDARRPFHLRYLPTPPTTGEDGVRHSTPRSGLWLRTVGPLPDDPTLHVCALTYASDLTLLNTVVVDRGLRWDEGDLQGASLDHAMWFHRPFRMDQWLLYDQESPRAAGARGLARGEIYTESGELVVSVVQEGLLRLRGH